MKNGEKLKNPVIRDSTQADLSEIQTTYSYEVKHGLSTFEEVAPAIEELAVRRQNILDLGLPFLVAEL